MRRKQLLILVALLFCMPLVQNGFAQRLLVGTYNIRNNGNDDHKHGNGWAQRVGVICDQILFEDPDVFGTQEVLLAQKHNMQQLLDGYNCIGVGRDDGKEAGEHELIWYKTNRVKLLDKGDFWLSETPEKPALGWDAACIRICSWGKFRHIETKKVFYFFNLHMDHVGIVARREAAKLIVKKVSEIAGNAQAIVTGDFNVDQNNEIYNILTDNDVLKDSYEAAQRKFVYNGTFNSYDPELYTTSRIDHILVSKTVAVDNYAVTPTFYWLPIANADKQKGAAAPQEIDFQKQLIRCASDHYPVWAKIRLK